MKSSFNYFTEKHWEGISIGIWIVTLIVWAIFAPTVSKELGAVWLMLYILSFIIASLAYFIIASRHD